MTEDNVFDTDVSAIEGTGRWAGYSYAECVAAYGEIGAEPPGIEGFNAVWVERQNQKFPYLNDIKTLAHDGRYVDTENSGLVWDTGLRYPRSRNVWYCNKRGEFFSRECAVCSSESEQFVFWGSDTPHQMKRDGIPIEKIVEWCDLEVE